MPPYRWHVLLTLAFFLVVTFIFFAAATASKEKVHIDTTPAEELAAPTISFIDPQSGAETPQVTIVEFADFACRACADLSSTLKQLQTKYPEDVRLVWKDFPNESHSGEATPAAIAARCADAQGAFWSYHDQLFLRQSALSDSTYQAIAQELSLDTQDFSTCLTSRDPLPRVRKDFDEGLALKITATPTLYINGERYTGAVSFNDLSTIVRSLTSTK